MSSFMYSHSSTFDKENEHAGLTGQASAVKGNRLSAKTPKRAALEALATKTPKTTIRKPMTTRTPLASKNQFGNAHTAQKKYLRAMLETPGSKVTKVRATLGNATPLRDVTNNTPLSKSHAKSIKKNHASVVSPKRSIIVSKSPTATKPRIASVTRTKPVREQSIRGRSLREMMFLNHLPASKTEKAGPEPGSHTQVIHKQETKAGPDDAMMPIEYMPPTAREDTFVPPIEANIAPLIEGTLFAQDPGFDLDAPTSYEFLDAPPPWEEDLVADTPSYMLDDPWNADASNLDVNDNIIDDDFSAFLFDI